MKKIIVYIALMLIMVLGISILSYGGKNMKIEVNGGTINGKLIDASKDKLVIFVAGSGPTDMNGNTPLVEGDNDSFLQLSKELKKEGISTFRYDKRTAGESLETFNNEGGIVFDDFIDDLNAVIKEMKALGYEKVVIMGHSQGSLIGMISAKEMGVDGYISIAGSGENIGKTMIKQYMVDENMYANHIDLINKLLKGETKANGEEIDPMFNMINQEFLLTWMKYNPKQEIAKLQIPILIIQGLKDLQVKEYDAKLLDESANDSELVLIEDMNHVLKEIGSDEDNVKSYGDPSYSLSKEMISNISEYTNKIGQ